MYTSLTDEEIIHQLLPLHPSQCFESLYNRYVTKVYRHCLRLTHNTESAQDFTHDIFIKIFTKLDHFNHKARFSTWLYTIAHNYCLDQIRRNKQRPLQLTDKSDWPDRAESEPVDREEERLHLLRGGMEMLSLAERTLLQVRYDEAKSVEEIAHLHGLSQSAIKMRLKRIREKLGRLCGYAQG